MGKVISGGGKYFTEKFKLGKIEGQILAGDKKAGLGPEKSGGPADPDPKAKEKKVARIIGSGGKVLASREGTSTNKDDTSSNRKPLAIVGQDNRIISSRDENEVGMDVYKARAARSQGASKIEITDPKKLASKTKRIQKQAKRKEKRADKRIERSEKRIAKHERKLKDTTDSVRKKRKQNRSDRQQGKIDSNKKKKTAIETDRVESIISA